MSLPPHDALTALHTMPQVMYLQYIDQSKAYSPNYPNSLRHMKYGKVYKCREVNESLFHCLDPWDRMKDRLYLDYYYVEVDHGTESVWRGLLPKSLFAKPRVRVKAGRL